jgi:long-chain acyl-CoA synthetase
VVAAAKLTTSLSTVATRNLARLAEAAFERRGDYPSLLFEERWHGSAELFERSRRLGGGLALLGVAPGDRVVVSMANCPEVTIAYQAIWRAGAVVTPATFLLPAPELRHIISDSEACAVITTPEFVDKVREAVAGLGSVKWVIVAGAGSESASELGSGSGSGPGSGLGSGSGPGSESGAGSGEAGGVIPLASVEQADPASVVARAEDDLAALLYTGGTTGRAKGVMISHGNLYFSSQALQQASHVAGLNRSLVTLPLSHAYGMLITVSGLHSPERPVTALLRWFDPAVFLELIEQHRLQQSAVVPSMIQLLLAQPLERYDLSSLRYLGSGAAPLPRRATEEIERRIPSVTVREGYGLTETAALISTNPPGHDKPGSVGVPIAGATVAILDDFDRELPPGEPGEICCRSPAVMRGYWRSPEATAEALRDGWLHTGDVGYLDEDGYLFIVDRKKDVIIRGGFNVYPRDVEDSLVEHPAVAAAGVVGRPDEIHGEEIVAFVSLSPPGAASAEELIEWARRRIGGYQYPREIHIVESLPWTPVGKLDRKALRRGLI